MPGLLAPIPTAAGLVPGVHICRDFLTQVVAYLFTVPNKRAAQIGFHLYSFFSFACGKEVCSRHGPDSRTHFSHRLLRGFLDREPMVTVMLLAAEQAEIYFVR